VAVVARAHVKERPLARVIYAIAARRFSGTLTVEQGGAAFRVGWKDGYVVAAASPLPADSLQRVALTVGLVTSTELGDAMRLGAQAASKSPLELIRAVARLTPAQVTALVRRTMAQQASRVFALEDASFSLDDAVHLPVEPDVPPLDPRWLIYFGLRTHYGESRLVAELGADADRAVRLTEAGIGALAAFGFGEVEKPCLATLRDRAATLTELSADSGGLSRAHLCAVVYALAACNYLEVSEPTEAQRLDADRPVLVTPQPPVEDPAAPGAAATRPAASEKAQQGSLRVKVGAGGTSRMAAAEVAAEIRALITEKLAALDADADHFELLGIARDAAPEQIRNAYFALAKKLHPDRLHAVQIHDLDAEAQRLFAHVNRVFATLTDPTKRSHYMQVLAAGGEAALAKQQREAEKLAESALAAEEHFALGELALRRNQFSDARKLFEEALSLNAQEGEYHAMVGWTTWCTMSDKDAAWEAVKKHLTTAMALSPRSPRVFFYRGQVAKQRGDTEAALECFAKVLELEPRHKEAELELRLLRRRAEAEGKKGGLFDRLKRR
jgi:tetratricopeptide (TPR) repeat protein